MRNRSLGRYFAAMKDTSGRTVRPQVTRKQFHCSNTSNLCDHCGKAMCLHSTGDYYCPLPAEGKTGG
jgi:hypothetical protein